LAFFHFLTVSERICQRRWLAAINGVNDITGEWNVVEIISLVSMDSGGWIGLYQQFISREIVFLTGPFAEVGTEGSRRVGSTSLEPNWCGRRITNEFVDRGSKFRGIPVCDVKSEIDDLDLALPPIRAFDADSLLGLFPSSRGTTRVSE
jgi:hypothetical protein